MRKISEKYHYAQNDPAPNAVYTAEDVANLQKQLAEAREELNAKDQIIKVSWWK